MRLPCAIHLMGYRVQVDVIGEDEWQHEEVEGYYDPSRRLIAVRDTGNAEAMLHTALHELTHAILMTLSYDELSADERFVDTFAGLLAQAITSAEYAAPIRRKTRKG